MAFIISNIVCRYSVKAIEDKLFALSLQTTTYIQSRGKKVLPGTPRLRNPTWFVRKNRTLHDDFVVPENKEFIKEVVADTFPLNSSSPLAKALSIDTEWTPGLRRTGIIARKIGSYPMWAKDGTKISTTLLQVLDNHVIKYWTPEEYSPARAPIYGVKKPKGCLLIGAEGTDPSLLTKEYCGIFKNTGVMPKKHLARFFISPSAALPPGTPLNAMHYQVGDFVDVRGKTIDHGFQGVIKRHGFKGMPASHGVTKTHRRPGNIGGGGEKGRVWPGTKLPGHMGNKWRTQRGLRIWRINTKYNVMWLQGMSIAGDTNSIVYIYDTLLKRRQPETALPFPTYLATGDESLPDDLYYEDVHKFDESTILFTDDSA